MLWNRAAGIATAAGAALLLGGLATSAGSAQGGAAGSYRLEAMQFQNGNGVLSGPSGPQAAVAVQTAASSVVSHLSAAQLAGQRVIYSYSGLTPPASLLTQIRHGLAAGVLFFGSNYANRTQFTAAVRKLEAANASSTNPARAYPLLLMTDQEGGEVRRLPGAPVLSEKQIGAKSPLSAAEAAATQAGSGAAANLRSFGLNVDLAPVLDVYRTPGDFDDQFQRSYSTRPTIVSALGSRFVTAMQKAKVAATAKHFPGLGAATASQNTDLRPVTLNLSAATVQDRDEYPYKAAIAAGVKLVMVSWAVYPKLGSTLPAGLSSVVVQGQLRKRLGYAGVTITDAIGAGALRAYGSTSNRSLMAAEAGMDLVLSAGQATNEGVQCLNGLENGYRTGKLGKAAFQAVVTQLLVLRKGLPA